MRSVADVVILTKPLGDITASPRCLASSGLRSARSAVLVITMSPNPAPMLALPVSVGLSARTKKPSSSFSSAAGLKSHVIGIVCSPSAATFSVPTPDQIDNTVLNAWWGHRQAGARVAVLAGSNDSVARLNHAAQRRRIDAGHLDPHGLAADGAHGYVLLVGDEIATRRNERGLRTDRGEMVRNRDHWTVSAIDPDGAIAARGAAGRVRLPAGYVCEAVELAYAETCHERPHNEPRLRRGRPRRPPDRERSARRRGPPGLG